MLRNVLLQKGLSNREVEVAELVSRGMANKEVADKLFVTEKTVKFHLTNIYKKMAIKSRSQLIVWCLPHLKIQEEQQAINEAQSMHISNQAPQELPYNGGFASSQNTLIAGNNNQLIGGSSQYGGNTTTGTSNRPDTPIFPNLPNGLKRD